MKGLGTMVQYHNGHTRAVGATRGWQVGGCRWYGINSTWSNMGDTKYPYRALCFFARFSMLHTLQDVGVEGIEPTLLQCPSLLVVNLLLLKSQVSYKSQVSNSDFLGSMQEHAR